MEESKKSATELMDEAIKIMVDAKIQYDRRQKRINFLVGLLFTILGLKLLLVILICVV